MLDSLGALARRCLSNNAHFAGGLPIGNRAGEHDRSCVPPTRALHDYHELGLVRRRPHQPEVPSSHRHAHAVDEIADRLAGDLLALRLGGLEMRHDLVDADGLRCVERTDLACLNDTSDDAARRPRTVISSRALTFEGVAHYTTPGFDSLA